jgi:hypothetical protein
MPYHSTTTARKSCTSLGPADTDFKTIPANRRDTVVLVRSLDSCPLRPLRQIRIARRVYDKGIREIARETGHSRNTVRKALEGEYEGYSPRKKQPFPALGPYLSYHMGPLPTAHHSAVIPRQASQASLLRACCTNNSVWCPPNFVQLQPPDLACVNGDIKSAVRPRDERAHPLFRQVSYNGCFDRHAIRVHL